MTAVNFSVTPPMFREVRLKGVPVGFIERPNRYQRWSLSLPMAGVWETHDTRRQAETAARQYLEVTA